MCDRHSAAACHSHCLRPGFKSLRLASGTSTPVLLIITIITITSTDRGVWGQKTLGTGGSNQQQLQQPTSVPTSASASASISPGPALPAPQLSPDYDYADPATAPAKPSQSKPPSAPGETASTGGATPSSPAAADDGLFFPLYGEASPQVGGATGSGATPISTAGLGPVIPLPPDYADLVNPALLAGPMRRHGEEGGNPAFPPPVRAPYPRVPGGEGGAWGERHEWLRERVKKLRKYGGGGGGGSTRELEALQRQFPGVNITRMYNAYGLYGGDGLGGYFTGDGYGERYGEGFRRPYGEDFRRPYGEDFRRPYGEDFGTGRPYGEGYGQGYGEGAEDGYFYNGTWYPGYEAEMEDGYYYNGTWYPGMGDAEDWYYHNGTWYPTLGDWWEDGYFHNGTWYPGLDEMDDWYYHNGTWYPILGDWEDGYFHNGTWYPGLGDMMEDGYYYNGTWYPGWGDAEDGYFFNGTWYPGYEREDLYEREGPEQEDLMWWQLHHPRWSGGAVNSVSDQKMLSAPVQRPPYLQVPPLNSAGTQPQQQQLPPPPYHWLGQQQQQRGLPPHLNRPGIVSPFAGRRETPRGRKVVQPPGKMQPQQTRQELLRSQGPAPPPSPPQRRFQQQQQYYRRPQALPMVQQQSPQGSRTSQSQPPAMRNQGGRRPLPPRRRPPPPGYIPHRRRGDQRNPRGRPQSARMTGGRRGPPPPQPRPERPNNKFSHAHGAPPLDPSHLGAQAPPPPVKLRPNSPLDPYRSTATVTMGIVIACLIGAVLILAPILCLLYKYRQEKRIKKRTFLRRAEHGSIDDGIMDAMVMSELGERKGSRVAKVGSRGGASVWKGGRKGGAGAGTSTAALARAKAELQPLETIPATRREREDVYSYIP